MQNYKTIDEYLTNFSAEQRKVLNKIRQTIQAAAPEATEKISYGIPTFVLHGNLVHFAAYQHHYGFYPGAAPLEALRDKLKSYPTSKGTVQFPADQPIPYNLITELTDLAVERNTQKVTS
jgi:uncharacterized protein YdhG (YjbR/CyaY superfamily)